VQTRRRARIRRPIFRPIPGLCLTIALLGGCGGHSDVQEIPEASQKALIQRKVDVKAGTAKASKSGQAPSTKRTRTP
jgi:hypothetical protein